MRELPIAVVSLCALLLTSLLARWVIVARAPRLVEPPSAPHVAGPFRDTAANEKEMLNLRGARATTSKQWILVGRVFPDPADPIWRQVSTSYFHGAVHVAPESARVWVAGRTIADPEAAAYIVAVVGQQCERHARLADAAFESELAKLPLAVQPLETAPAVIKEP